MKQKQAFMRSRSRTRLEGTRLLFLFKTLCWWCSQSYQVWCVLLTDSTRTTKKAGRKKDKPRRGQKQRAKTNSRPQRSCGFVCLLFRGGPVWYRMIYRNISWYHIPYHAMSQDDISTYCIHIPNFWDWYRDVVSRRNIPRYWAHFFAHFRCTKRVKEIMNIWR